MNTKNYKVYVHIFPDGKRYVGCTHGSVKNRWNGGLGYENQNIVFAAILKFGWNNIRHYILMDELSREDALLYEAAFIRSWKTYMKGRGYNAIAPKVSGADDINIPSFRECPKKKVDDIYTEETNVRRKRKYLNQNRRARRVRCIETGEIFDNADAASVRYGNGKTGSIYSAIRTGYASGLCDIYDDELVFEREVPAHWEYVE